MISSDHLVESNPDSPVQHSDNETGPRPPRSASRPKRDKQPKRTRPALHQELGMNVHSSVARISTSKALALLDPPPEDAKIGSADLPWLRLTQWEMTKLRKKMKKSAAWQPSEIMIHRELFIRGRGWENYKTAKAHAERNGEEFVDCDDIMNNYVPGKLTRKTDAMTGLAGLGETKLSNRGMKLNEAKKLKREALARKQAALAAAEAEMAAKRLGDIGSSFKSLFSSPMDHNPGVSGLIGGSARSSVPAAKEKEKSKTLKKRKSEEPAATETTTFTQKNTDSDIVAGAAGPAGPAGPASKKRRMNKSMTVNTDIEMASVSGGPSTNTTLTAAPSTATNLQWNGTAPSSSLQKPTPTPSPTGSRPPMSASMPPARLQALQPQFRR